MSNEPFDLTTGRPIEGWAHDMIGKQASRRQARYSTGGFEARFNVSRTDGKPCRAEARYIVLDYAGDPHAKKALAVYADSIEADNPRLAADIRDALVNPASYPSQHE